MATYAWADLHGRFDLLMEGIQHLKPEDKVYFLGDAADRGPDGWKCIKYILNDKRFTYIKGNHEQFLLNVFGNLTVDNFDADMFFWDHKLDLWFNNGGMPTYEAILNDTTISKEEIIATINKLKTLPFCIIYYNIKGQNVLLSHAGCDNFETAEIWDEEKFLWDRIHLMFYDSWYGNDNEIIVHGHTPIELMIKEQQHNIEFLIYKNQKEGVVGDSLTAPLPWKKQGAYWYAKNHKCNIDTGAVWNSNSVLLNLDTWEEIIITTTSPKD